MEAIKRTDYSTKLKLAKWSEKVAGMKLIIECGGEKPYKLSQPSSSCNYVPLIHEMKSILSHTHYLVVSKAMEVLAMEVATRPIRLLVVTVHTTHAPGRRSTTHALSVILRITIAWKPMR